MRPEIENTPVPIWMKDLPRDKRGYPIPVIVVRDKAGTPHFTVNDDGVRQLVINKDKCGICGKKLLRWRALVGGPVSAFDEHGGYIDPPMHIECAQYALQVCPYLAVPSWSNEIGTKKIEKTKVPLVSGVTKEELPNILIDQNALPGRPERQLFVLVVYTKAKETYFNNSKQVTQYLIPNKPYVRIEVWRFGKQLEQEAGVTEVKSALLEHYQKGYDEAVPQADELIVKALVSTKPKGLLRYQQR